MANHPSAKKRNRQNINRRARNFAVRSQMRGAIKSARAALTSGSADKAEVVQTAVRAIYRAASKNIIKPGTASRRVGRLMRALR